MRSTANSVGPGFLVLKTLKVTRKQVMKKTVELDDRKITVLGTAHVSEESRKQVIEIVDEIEPDLIGVELDAKRFDSLTNESGWRDLDIVEAIRDGKGYLLLFNLLLSIYQRRIGMEEGVKPGAEMLEAVEQAQEKGIEYELVDRDINTTFERIRDELTFWEKIKLFNFFQTEDLDLSIEELKQEDIVGSIVKDLEKDFPSVKQVFLDERNIYMVEQLMEREFDHALLVVGAAHVEGIIDELEGNNAELPEMRKKFIPWFKVVNYGIPVVILSMLAYAFIGIDFSTGIEATTFWILANGVGALLGAILARSHLLTWFAAFFSSPLTSLTPVVGAGMVAAYVEGRFYPPKVKELEDIAYISHYKELWHNQVGRILLTFGLVSLFGALATFIGAGYIASLIAAI